MSDASSTIPYCPDCGPATVSHAIERWSIRADMLVRWLTLPPQLIWEGLKPLIAPLKPGRLAPFVLRAAAVLRLGTIIDKADEQDNWRNKVLWEEAEHRGIIMKEFRPLGLPRDVFIATKNGDTRLFDGLPRPRAAKESSLSWMDNKGIILKKFRDGGVPVPRGESIRAVAQAEKIFNEITDDGKVGAVIVKPTIGSRSRHTYVNITDIASLRKAFFKAKQISPCVVVEEELSGFVFRITLVGGKLAGLMRREPPHVMGDGKRTITQLIEIENKNPLRHGPIFHELHVDDDGLAILKEQKLSLNDVPEKDRMVTLHPKVSRSFGASTTEITDIHPENQKLFLRMAAVLEDPIVGIDFMINDMAKPWQEQKCGVIECNSLPFIDLHHYPLKGPARNVAGLVWDIAFQ